MSWKNAEDRWGPVSQLLHWLIVVLIVTMAVLGLTMVELPAGATKVRVYALHKSLGLTVLALATLRLGWRLFAGAPRPLAGMPPLQRRAAQVTHAALYVLLFALPLSGWVINSSAGFPLQWFGLIDLPALTATDEALHERAEAFHENAFWLLIVLAVAHAGAAFYHHLFLQDDTLRRMLPGRRSAGSTSDAP
ncbi:MAG TPA: cytochrome b [Lysobacter sp.]|nr:cytochrome b [Lysobacter sp.]